MPNRDKQQIDQVLEAADHMTAAELDRLPYGMIQLDSSGRILHYNAVESSLASLRREDAIGKQFFTSQVPQLASAVFRSRHCLQSTSIFRKSKAMSSTHG